jgi:hypothetical protein
MKNAVPAECKTIFHENSKKVVLCQFLTNPLRAKVAVSKRNL